jgi:hypothetical protein
VQPDHVDLGLVRARRGDQDQVEDAGGRHQHDDQHQRAGREQRRADDGAQPPSAAHPERRGHPHETGRDRVQTAPEDHDGEPRPLPGERQAEHQPDPRGPEQEVAVLRDQPERQAGHQRRHRDRRREHADPPVRPDRPRHQQSEDTDHRGQDQPEQAVAQCVAHLPVVKHVGVVAQPAVQAVDHRPRQRQ